MKTNTPKIKISVKGTMLDAFRAISGEFDNCEKLADILTSIQAQKKTLKINDEDFDCLYKGVLTALDNKTRYPNKTSNEYNEVLRIKSFLEESFSLQRGHRKIHRSLKNEK
jgi:hypothetical protein